MTKLPMAIAVMALVLPVLKPLVAEVGVPMVAANAIA